MARLKDIASLTGVSVSTVSKALRGRDDINPRTREQIVEAAARVKYVPRGRSPDGEAPQPSGAIGVICPEIRSGYYAGIITALESFLRRRGFGMLLGFTDFLYQREAALLEQFGRLAVPGIVCVTEHERIEYDLRSFRRTHDVPVVVLATVIAIEDFDSVKVNDELGVRMAVRHLHELGHTRVGFVGDSVSRQRRDVFCSSLRQCGIAVREEYLRMGAERFEQGGYLRMKELLSTRVPPTGVLAAYDDVAIGALRAASEAGLRVPQDVSIIGIDGIEVGGYLPTTLTTIATDTAEMAEAAGRILLRKIGNRSFAVVQHLEVNPQLIVRESTAAPGPRGARGARVARDSRAARPPRARKA